MSEALDVAIVGAGTAGLSALREVNKRTANFVIVNDGPWGTICARASARAVILANEGFQLCVLLRKFENLYWFRPEAAVADVAVAAVFALLRKEKTAMTRLTNLLFAAILEDLKLQEARTQ